MGGTASRGLGPLAITAYSVCNGMGLTTQEVVSALSESRSGLAPPSFALPFETVCGEVTGDLPHPPEHLSIYDTHQARIALRVLEEIRLPLSAAIERWGADRVGMVMATSTGGISASEDAYDTFKRTAELPQAYDYEHQHCFHAFSDLLAKVARIRGPSYVISTACSSSGKVLAAARRLIAADAADAVLVGGVDSLARTTLYGFMGLSVLSSTQCRPFDAKRDGMNIGEGGALLLVERSGPARALLLGTGESSDAYHMSSPHPEGLGARKAMSEALAQAELSASRVDYINAHGTGTMHNDAAEAHAIASMFGGDVPVVSTKGFTGHLLGAAGATEAIFAILSLEQQWIPANYGCIEPDVSLPIRVNTSKLDHPCSIVMSNSFGFGGSNVSILMGRP